VGWQVKVSTPQTFIMETETTSSLNFPADLTSMRRAVANVVDLLRGHTNG
jgi:hypothetical protein